MNNTLAGKMTFKRITDNKQIKLLTYICTLIYFTSYMTRLNYGAVVAEIERAEGIPKDMLSFAVTGLFITYGVGQLISGWLGDRIPPKYLMFCGLALSTLMNVLLPLNTNVVYMTVIWCINGFGQALMWPPIVKILSGYLSSANYVKATFTVIIGSTCGSIGVYLAASACIALANWQTLFYLCAAFGIIGMFLCMAGISKIEKYANEYGEEAEQVKVSDDGVKHTSYVKTTGAIGAMIAVIMVAIVLQGSLRDGVTTWLPSYIENTFNLGTAASILSGVVLPLFTLACVTAVKAIFPRFIKNELAFAGIIFGIGAVAAVVLVLFPDSNPIVSILFSALLVACMHGVNQMLIAILPGQFRKTGKISTISGLLNFATYVGAALSTYCFAALAKDGNWRPVIILWVFIAAAGSLICFCLVKAWKKFKEIK